MCMSVCDIAMNMDVKMLIYQNVLISAKMTVFILTFQHHLPIYRLLTIILASQHNCKGSYIENHYLHAPFIDNHFLPLTSLGGQRTPEEMCNVSFAHGQSQELMFKRQKMAEPYRSTRAAA